MVLKLSATHIASLWNMPLAVETMQSLCVSEAAARTLSSDRIHIELPRGGFLRVLPGVLLDKGVMGYKEFHTGADGPRYTIHLFDYESGRHLAYLDAGGITVLRTGAMGAVALKRLAPENASLLGVIGSGKEALSAIQGLKLVRPDITEGWIYSPNPTSRESFASKVADELGISLKPVDSGIAAVRDAHVVIAATTTRGHVALQGSWLRKGIHISSVAATSPETREIDEDVWALADRVIVDTPRLLEESGDAIAAHEAGSWIRQGSSPSRTSSQGRAPDACMKAKRPCTSPSGPAFRTLPRPTGSSGRPRN